MLIAEYSQGVANDGPSILRDGQAMTPEEIVSELNALQSAANAGIELAGYASYSEICGQIIGSNSGAIRKYCDIVYDLMHKTNLLGAQNEKQRNPNE